MKMDCVTHRDVKHPSTFDALALTKLLRSKVISSSLARVFDLTIAVLTLILAPLALLVVTLGERPLVIKLCGARKE